MLKVFNDRLIFLVTWHRCVSCHHSTILCFRQQMWRFSPLKTRHHSIFVSLVLPYWMHLWSQPLLTILPYSNLCKVSKNGWFPLWKNVIFLQYLSSQVVFCIEQIEESCRDHKNKLDHDPSCCLFVLDKMKFAAKIGHFWPFCLTI